MRRWFVATALLVSLPALALGDAPEISRSVGKKGGILVLWPRVTGETEGPDDSATQVQGALVRLAQGLTDRLDVRPQPERVCPLEKGCKAVALGAVVARSGEGCAVVVSVSEPGVSPAKLVPWVGELKLKNTTVAFRQPPETQVIVTDFTPCEDLAQALAEGTDKIVKALKSAMDE